MFAAPPAQGGFGYSEVTAYAQMNDLTGIGFSGKLGLGYKVNDQISLGVVYTSSTPLTYKSGKAIMDMTTQFNDAFGRAMQGYMAAHTGVTQAQAQAAVMAQFAGLGIDLSKGVQAHYDLQAKLTMPQSVGAGVSMRVSDALRRSSRLSWRTMSCSAPRIRFSDRSASTLVMSWH